MVKHEYVVGDLWLNARGDVCEISHDSVECRFGYRIIRENSETHLPRRHDIGRFGLSDKNDGLVSTREDYWRDYRLVDRYYTECPY